MKKWLGRGLIVVLIGLVLLYFGAKDFLQQWVANTPVSAPAPQTPAPKNEGVLVDVVFAKEQRLAQQVTAVGSLLAQNATMVRAESSGRIARILFEEGTAVRAGTTLVLLDTDVLQAELQQAQAQLSLATSRSRRATQLSKQGFISAQAQDESASEQAVALAQVNIIKTKMDKSQIKAPFDGVLGLRNVSVGDYVNNGTDIVSLASIDKLQVDFRVPEQYLSQLYVGSAIRLRLDAQADQEFVGQVNAISPLVDEQGRSVLLRAHVPNDKGVLRPGLFARVIVDLAEVDAIMVPETALSPAGQAQYVYRVVGENMAQRIEVAVGIRRDGWVQVTGIQAGDKILTTGLQKVQDGSQIRFEPPVDQTLAASTKG